MSFLIRMWGNKFAGRHFFCKSTYALRIAPDCFKIHFHLNSYEIFRGSVKRSLRFQVKTLISEI